MQIEEAKQHIEIFKMALRSKQCLDEQELEEYKLCQSLDTVLNYIETMHSEFDRLESIEDNTIMLKQELKEQTEANKELNKVIITYKAMINEMAELISRKVGSRTEICSNMKCNKSIEECKECAIDYFYKKVSDNK